jgi:hypothetical protein
VPVHLPACPAETDGKVVRTLVKLTLFRQFYIMVRPLPPLHVLPAMPAGLRRAGFVPGAMHRSITSLALPPSLTVQPAHACVALTRITSPYRIVLPAVQVVCFIYFTRIIVYLLESTLPYQFIWLAFAASELATLVFYVARGISFRPMPAGANPYFQLTEEEAIELTKADMEDP